jgi:hypothetical protein
MGTPRRSGSRFLDGRFARRDAEGLPPLAIAPYSAEQVAFAAGAWTMRAEQEHHSAAVFADALAFLADADVPLDVLASLSRIVTDEIAHTELCATVARRFGAPEPRCEPLPRPPPPSTPQERRSRGLEIVAMEGAIGESVSSALFLAGQRDAREPCTKAALGAILRDEVVHARTCWDVLAVLVPGLDDAARARLRDHVRRGLGAFERTSILPALQRLERGDPFDPGWAALGTLHPERRVEAFYGALERRALPRLDALGLDGRGAWRDRFVVPDAG